MNFTHLVKNIIRSVTAQTILFLFRNSKNKNIIVEDIKRWQKILKIIQPEGTLNSLLLNLFQTWPEYRNLFYYRLSGDPIKYHFVFSIAYRLYPPMDDLKLYAFEGIGPGLFIQHGRSSGIMAQRVGNNCFINQHVSIGFNRVGQRPPIIGNNVSIRAGAKVYGSIHIGDNAVIGANSVVTKDVPPNCTVVGVPAKIIRRNGKRVDENLY